MKYSSLAYALFLSTASVTLSASDVAGEQFAIRGGFEGFYAGIFGGVAGARFEGIIDRDEVPEWRENFSNRWNNGGIFGGYIGYNKVYENVLLGIEGDIGYGDFSETAVQEDGRHDRATHEVKLVASARARLGVLVSEETLLYATGGLAYLPSEFIIRDDVFTAPHSGSKNLRSIGYVVGLGFEQALTDRLHVRLEGLYYDGMPKHSFFEDELVSGVDKNDFVRINDFYQIRAGVSLNF